VSARAAARPATAARSGAGALRTLAWHVPMALGAVALLTPFFWMLSTSLKEEGREFILPLQLIPNPVVWSNYPIAMTKLPFPLYLLNTLIVTIGSLTGTVVTGSMAAFAFARLRFPGRSFLFTLLLSTLMLPEAVTLIPKFIIFRNLGWVNTLNPLWVPWWFGGGAFNVFLLRQFLMTLPHDLDEAARIDGASNWRVWWNIILPLSYPVLVAIGIFSFVAHWNEFLEALIFLNSESLKTLSLGLRAFLAPSDASWHITMAASMWLVVPMMAVFFVGQRYFIKGVAMTGIAGR
jgi:multiple sugar transport system permease protein